VERGHKGRNDQEKRGPGLATRLTAVALKKSTHFIAAGKAYLSAGRQCFPVASTRCRRWLGSLSLQHFQQAANDNHIKNCVSALEAVAHHKDNEGAVHRRLARVGDTIYLDLSDKEGRIVKITPAGWEVGTDYPVHFLRGPNMAPQVVPQKGGSVEDLFNLVNLPPEERPLLLGFLLDCLKGVGPYTILLIGGPQGSAKSTLSKMVRQIVDPAHKAAVRYLQRDVGELALAAEHNALMAYDNVSSLPQWLSDALASLATGSGFGARKFYAQDEEVVFGDSRPIVFNGIPDFADSPDLLDRCIKVNLPSIPDEQRKTDEEVSAAFRRVLPGALGDLLDMVAVGLGNPRVVCDRLPRIASSAKWIMACGCRDFADTYARNREVLADLALANSDLAQGLLILFDQTKTNVEGKVVAPSQALPWAGTATELLEALNNPCGPVPGALHDSRKWPKGNSALSAELNRIAPDLARKGLVVERVVIHGVKLIRVRQDHLAG
jgi:hypothetical protein